MRELIDRLVLWVEALVVALAAFGAFLIFVQMIWISYGVFMRYVMGAPDRLVTEATALLLFPVALVGLAFAMREDSYPRVTLLTDKLRPGLQKLLALFNGAIMVLIGLFFSITTINATIRAFNSGAASEILRWPRFLFWAPVALSLTLFTLYAVLRLVQLALRSAPAAEARDGMV
ncbi:MAG: TRAP transporter small permease subunit [Pseudotabrizicola sp.]|uniref:TRAP transporter small permease n=1 Tax=Pseudotabrizicola sp. TaxID=2939647 RepID=UPI002726B998|nr:TRAP transporter small permease subunit [Pseudotabrizicola sp.]MDO8883308.1 TRAP transporter small permease subunit [Pseudotabrizicola sp.]MDP2083524.1 TRAP transporter small permease subunit [Pseudotabrizicola sp.]MDZ7575043.1 TRAP transporter small permease subunit [Pseudotabrizicola sp.]